MHCLGRAVSNLQSVGEEHSPFLVLFLTGKDQWRQPDGGRRQFYCWGSLCSAPTGDPTRRDSGRRSIDQSWDSDTRYWSAAFFHLPSVTRGLCALAKYETNYSGAFLPPWDDSPVVVVVFLPTEKYLMNHYPSLCARGLSFQRQHRIDARHSWAKMKTSFEWSDDVRMSF